MLPEEGQALMAKMLLIIFGTIMLCFSKVRADQLVDHSGQEAFAYQFIAQGFEKE